MKYVIIAIVRELSKILMFTALWALPLLVARDTGNYRYLWLLLISIWGTISLFSHYEYLEKGDNNVTLNKKNEQDNVGQ